MGAFQRFGNAEQASNERKFEQVFCPIGVGVGQNADGICVRNAGEELSSPVVINIGIESAILLNDIPGHIP